MNSLREKINQLAKNKKATRKWSRAVISLALVVALITTTVLINPAHATSEGDGATQTVGGETVSGNAEAAAASEGTAALADAEENAKEEAAAAGEQLLTYTGEDYAIEMTYGTDAGITDGSTLTAAEITDDAAKDAYLKEARSAIQADSDKKVEGRFFDLTIKDAEGQVYEPLAPVNVKITYTHKDPVADNRSDLQAVHITDAADKSAEIKDPTTTDLASTKVEVTNQTKDTTADTAEFTAESFSIYGIVYTVDFTIDTRTFNLIGGHSINLSELMAKLGVKDFNISKVKNVTFTNPELLSITNTGADWLLTSLQPFQTNERLVIEMVDGSKITIGVTDAIENKSDAKDFSDYITSADVRKWENGDWIVPEGKKFTDGDQVKATLNFSIPAGVVTKDHPTITYQLPGGIRPIEATSGIAYRGKTPVGTYEIGADGKIYIQYYDSFATGDAFTGDISFQGTVSRNDAGKGGEVKFDGNGGTITVEPGSTQYDMNVTKSVDGEYNGSAIDKSDNSNWKAKFRVTVASNRGTDPDQKITITDDIDGKSTASGSYKKDSFKLYKYDAKGNKTEVSATPTFKTNESTNESTNGFEYTNLPALKVGERYEVEYTVEHLEAKAKDNGGTDDGSSKIINNAGATSGNLKPSVPKELEVSKSSVAKSGWYDSTKRGIQWTITINQSKSDINGKVFEDTLPESLDLTSLPKENGYYYVEMKNEDAPNNPIHIAVGSDRKISYTFGENSNHQYTITYFTRVDESKLGEDRKVSNTATFDGHEATGSADVPVNDWGITKQFVSEEDANGLTFHWSTSVNIKDPIDKTTGVTVTDTIESATVGDSTVFHYANQYPLEQAIKKNLTVKDINGNDCTKNVDINIICYDKDGKELTPEGGGLVTKFSVKVTSKTDEPVNATTLYISDYPTTIKSNDMVKGNNYSFNNKAVVANKSSEASHDYMIPVPMKKYVQTAGTSEQPQEDTNRFSSGDAVLNYDDAIINKDGKHILTYMITVDPASMLSDTNGIYNGFTLSDILPAGTTLLDGSLDFYVIHGINYTNAARNLTNYQLPQNKLTFGESSRVTSGPITVTKSESDGQQTLNITFAEKDTSGNDLHENASKDKSCQFMIRYSVVIDDLYKDATITTHKFTNSLSWENVGTVSQSTDVDRNYKKVKKTGAQRLDSAGNPTDYIDYNIIVNAKGEDLSPATNTIKLQDNMSGQYDATANLDLTSVNVYHYDPTKQNGVGSPLDATLYTINYDDTDSNGKRVINMVLPDQMPLVVTYTYEIARKNDNDQKTFTNSITLSGKFADSEKTVLKQITSSSNASRQYITIYKMDSQTYKLLSGAKFKIWSWNKTDIKWEEVEGYSDYSIQKNEDGTWNNQLGPGENSPFQTDRLYRIQEQDPPKGYDKNESFYYFLFNGKNANGSMEDDGTAKSNAGVYDGNNGVGQSTIHCIGTSGGNIQIDDESIGITAKKIWMDQKGNEFVPQDGKVKVELIQHSSADVVTYGHKVTVMIMDHNHPKDDKSAKEVQTYTVADKGSFALTIRKDQNKQVTITDSTGADRSYTTNNNAPTTVTWAQVTADFTIRVMTVDDWLIGDAISPEYDEAGWGFKDNSGTVKDTKELKYDTDSEDCWQVSWDSVPKKDDQGNPYYYEIKEVSSTEGYTTSYTNNGISTGTITVTNRQKPTKHFTFTKKWIEKNSTEVTTWPSGKEIVVTLTGTPDSGAGSSVTYTFKINGQTATSRTDNSGGNITISKTDDESGFSYLIDNLPEGYIYTIKETKLDGYKEPEYLAADGSSLTDQTKGAADGQIIKNVEENAYELPSTGGRGTANTFALGLAMVSFALLALGIHLKKRELEEAKG